ncbi:hypothetical protein [Cupriavidus taiwanensis]|uniref:hypothetical protein n=1 Tax=Cupriavidus taiwanensis TaxID=164546 RepID=UPI000E203A90|nr:hypothetical protein [Cupriavidus taiwanensis]
MHKKTVYLDQSFFSGAFRERDPRFVRAAAKVRDATQQQLLVAPYSSLHEDETHQWRGHDGKLPADLMDFIKRTSSGHEFEPDYDIERVQILKAFQAFLSGGPSEYVLEEDDVLNENVHTWQDYIFIDVPGYFKDVEQIRELKADAVAQLVSLFDGWQRADTTFEEDVAAELRAAPKVYIEPYVEMLTEMAKGNFMVYMNAPIVTTVVESMRHCLPKVMPLREQLQRCAQFFQSEHFAQIPYQYMSARMFAALKHQVKHGAYANREDAKRRLSGVFYDVKHISLFGPYCDAITVDGPMAGLVRQPTVGLEARYGTKVFSVGTFDALEAWCDELSEGVSDDHRRGLADAYGKTA